ncbi:putative ribonuclease H protein [Citrus sinensis]|nr:putative ribonuclease H protein [Citrus sinensis]
MVSWRNVCKPKSIGGLGFKSLSMMNKALHMKLAWGFISSPESLWVTVLRTKYGVAKDTLPETLHTRYGSHLWKSIGTVWSEVLTSRRWCLGNGESVRFWWDLWVTKDMPLATYAMDTIPVNILDCKVSVFIKNDGSWWWDQFEYLLPNNIILQIAVVLPPSSMHGTDTCFWTHSRTGLFTTKSTYLMLARSSLVIEDYRWRSVWRWKSPQSVRIFLWLALQDRLKTKTELAQRHVPISEACDRCGASVEDTLHVLRDCMVARTFWLKIVPLEKRQSFFNSNLSTWLCGNVEDVSRSQNISNWIWFWRNQFVFNKASMDPTALLVDVSLRAEEMSKIHNHCLVTRKLKIEKWIRWHPPDWPWCTLNTDGAHKANGVSTAGGLIRDYSGHWLTGFGLMLGSCSVTIAELRGIYHGLILAWNFGIRWLHVETDSLCATQMLANQVETTNEYASLIFAIKEYLQKKDCQVSISHVYREANLAADFMANLACSLPLGLMVYPSPPLGVSSILLYDSYGVATPRSVVF